MVIFGNGEQQNTDFVTSIPDPKCVYIRLPDLNMLDAMKLATNEKAMDKITYNETSFKKCKVIAVSDERGTPKIIASYTEIAKGE